MYAAASNKLKNDEKDGRAAAVSSDDEGSTTAVTTKVLPSSTSPKDFHPFTGGRFVEAGCHSKVFCFYDEDEKQSKKLHSPTGKFKGKCGKGDYPLPGSVIALHGYHLDPHRFKDLSKKADFYGVIVPWDEDRFPNKEEDWVQVSVIANGEYVINHLEKIDSPNFLFELVIKNTELEVVVPAGSKSFEVFGDNYGLNPLRWFRCNQNGFYSVRKIYPSRQCPRCLDPGCILYADSATKDIVKICEDIKNERKNLANNQLRFMAYKAIARHQYGHLPKGVRRRLGICCELYVRNQFPAPEGMPYVDFKPSK